VWKKFATKVNRRSVLVLAMALFLVMFVLVLAAYLYERSRNERLRSELSQRESSQGSESLSEEDREGVALYVEALGAIRGGYVDQESIEPKEQTYAAIKGMLDSLGDERHTRFQTPEEVEKMRKALSNKQVDTGVRLEDRGYEVVSLTPIGGSPAEEAGIESGDVMLAVNGQSIQGEDITAVTERLKGTEGSLVGLTVLRNGEERELSIERVEIEVPAATWNLVPGTGVAYLRLALFSENSAAELNKAIAEVREAGAERFVLDFRENMGGKVNQAEKIAAQFLPAGSTIYIRREAGGEKQETTVPDDSEPSVDTPLVILVNAESASSAEIVAGALRDNDRAEVVGETTFGTGTVLDDFVLSDGSSILLAVAEWLTPNGAPIRGAGIEPDVEVRLEQGQKLRTPDEVRGLSKEKIFAEDAQLERAFKVLQEEQSTRY
jgi:carboxyl-terminal processing protease